MTGRKGEQAGWIFGWLGSIIWVFILAVVFLFKSLMVEGLAGIFLVGLAVGLIFRLSPWRNPDTPYWKLMAPLYLVLMVMAAWAIWAFHHMDPSEKIWNYSLLAALIPLFIPLASIGKRRWRDH